MTIVVPHGYESLEKRDLEADELTGGSGVGTDGIFAGGPCWFREEIKRVASSVISDTCFDHEKSLTRSPPAADNFAAACGEFATSQTRSAISLGENRPK